MKIPYVPIEDLNKPAIELGQVYFVVLDAEETNSKSNEPVIKLSLELRDNNGNTLKVFDWLPSSPKMAKKIYSFCCSVGHPEWYSSNGSILAPMCKGLKGRCDVTLKKTPGENEYVNVKEYLKPKGNGYIGSSGSRNDFEDDEMPF
jgi:hypothetical protein